MAEEEGLGGELEGGGKSKTMLFVIIGVVLILLGVGGYFGYTMFVAPPEMTDEEKAKMEASENDSSVKMQSMEPMIVNLLETGGRRYLKVTMDFEVRGEKNLDEFKAKLPKIQDSILTLLSSKTFDEVYSVKGKFKLREEILIRVRNKMIDKDSVMNVYFTEFVIQ